MSKGSWQDVPSEPESVIDDEDVIEIEIDDDDEPGKQAIPDHDEKN